MAAHRIYAQVDAGIVKNVMVCADYEDASYLSRATYGDDALAIDVTNIPCMIGDAYRDGTFYRDGKAVTPEASTEASIADLKAGQNEIILALAALIGGEGNE